MTVECYVSDYKILKQRLTILSPKVLEASIFGFERIVAVIRQSLLSFLGLKSVVSNPDLFSSCSGPGCLIWSVLPAQIPAAFTLVVEDVFVEVVRLAYLTKKIMKSYLERRFLSWESIKHLKPYGSKSPRNILEMLKQAPSHGTAQALLTLPQCPTIYQLKGYIIRRKRKLLFIIFRYYSFEEI